jgi:hypothetical protein
MLGCLREWFECVESYPAHHVGRPKDRVGRICDQWLLGFGRHWQLDVYVEISVDSVFENRPAVDVLVVGVVVEIHGS